MANNYFDKKRIDGDKQYMIIHPSGSAYIGEIENPGHPRWIAGMDGKIRKDDDCEIEQKLLDCYDAHIMCLKIMDKQWREIV